MATLFNKEMQQRYFLQSHHSFGRLKNSVNTFIDDSFVSKVHAFIEWNDRYWLLRDVSSNGTWLNGNKLSRNQVVQLNVGDVINFASNSSNVFEVFDTKAPCDCLVPIEHNSEVIELEYFHLLPSQESHEILLRYNNQSCSWWQEVLDDDLSESATPMELRNQEYIIFNGLKWQLQINRPLAETQIVKPSVTSLNELTFIFQTSLDEESTHLVIQTGDRNIDLLVRSHHYLTLCLARQRVKDIKAGFDNSEQGWLYAESLAKDLGVDASHLNIQIYRIRKQFVEALNNTCETSNIIERNTGKIRLASKFFKIIKGDKVEYDTRCQ